MAKRSQKRPVRHEKEQLGCMWGLRSIFDFRHGRFTQKLLPDRCRGGKFATGDGNAINKLGMLTGIDNNEGTFESKTAAADVVKPSVKKLMEEEMAIEQNTKKEINKAEVEPKHSHKEQGSPRKKTCKGTNKAQKKNCDGITDLDAPESLGAEQPCHQNSEHQSTGSLDIDNVMEEFCHQIHQRSIRYMKHEQQGDLCVQSNQKNPEFEEKLREAIKLLISQKFIKGKHLSEDREIHPSKEQLTDALQILGSDAKLFVKHLQDPNSLLVKFIQDFPGGQLEKDEDSMPVAGSNLSEQELGNLRPSDELVNHKPPRKFFRRKVKSQERSPSNEEKTPRASNRIVILKPRITGSQNPEAESTVGSSPESHYVIRNKGPNERIGSRFFLSEIKRKLKYAMGKEHQVHGIQKRLSYEGQNFGNRDKGVKENVGMNSPTKDHFFIEKIARPVGVKKVDKTGKLKDCELVTEHKSTDLTKQRVSNIYIEAKKHLSEMLSTGDESLNSSSGRIPKTLGRILSFPEYNFSPGSPGRNREDGFVTAQRRYVDSDKFHQVNENTSSPKQGSHLGQTIKSLETEHCISDESSDNKLPVHTFNSDNLVQHIHDDEVKGASFSVQDEMSSRGNVEIVKTNVIAVQEESNVLDTPNQPRSSSSIKGAEQTEDMYVIWNGQRHSKHLKEDSEDNQLPASPLTSPSNTLVTQMLEYQETAINILEHRSPISVLELLFAEDEISPARTRSHIVDVPVQPNQIQFEEHASSAAQSIQMKSSVEDKESMFEYVKAVLQVSGLNWDELCVKSISTDQLLDPSLFDDVEFSPNQLCCDAKLLFDLINEVLMEICGHYFGCLPWVSFIKHYIQPIPNEENALSEVWQRILWHLIPLAMPHTLEQTVRKDMAKSGTWMDLRFEADSVGIEMGDAIFEELIEDTILSCVKESLESECLLLLAQLKESESNANSESFCALPPAELENESSI